MESTNTLQSTMATKRERNYGIDLLRIICMIMIPILHILGHGGVLNATTPLSFDFFAYWFVEIACYGAVNMFGIISGYVGVDSKFKLSNLVIIILRALFYSIIISAIFFIAQLETITTSGVINALFPIAREQWWYISAYAAMFLFTPFINLAFRKIELKKMIAFVGLLFLIFACLICLVNAGNNPRILNGGYAPFWLLILYCFGALIKKLNDEKFSLFKKNYLNLLVAIGLILLTFISMLIIAFATDGSMVNVFNFQYLVSYVSPFVAGSSILIVVFMKNIKIKNKVVIKGISFIAPLCLSVYLIHDHNFMRAHIIKGNYTFLLNYNPLLSILIVIASAIAIFICCCLIDLIREFIFKKTHLKTHLDNIEQKAKDKIFGFIDRKIAKNKD